MAATSTTSIYEDEFSTSKQYPLRIISFATHMRNMSEEASMELMVKGWHKELAWVKTLTS
jgi:hypothetical protein